MNRAMNRLNPAERNTFYTKKVSAIVTMFVAIFFCLSAPTVSAYAPKVEPTTAETDTEEGEIPLKPVGDPLTPEGNLSLVDDIITNNENDKQFITAQSKSGHYFYLVIDRAGEENNVYLLNMVDEADLMALMYDEEVEVTYSLVTETEEEVIEEVEPEPEPEPDPEPEPEEGAEETKRGSSLPLVFALLALGGGGFYYYKSKIATKGSSQPSLESLDDEDMDFDVEENLSEDDLD